MCGEGLHVLLIKQNRWKYYHVRGFRCSSGKVEVLERLSCEVMIFFFFTFKDDHPVQVLLPTQEVPLQDCPKLNTFNPGILLTPAPSSKAISSLHCPSLSKVNSIVALHPRGLPSSEMMMMKDVL